MANRHFLRVIVTEDHARLKLPPRFLKRYGNTLSKKGCLKAVNSPLTWEVETSRSREGRVWLIKGWKEFVEHYSIEFGQMLMFEYEGKTRFTVSIFGADTMEVQYPVEEEKNYHNGKPKPEEEEPEVMDDSHDEDYDCGSDINYDYEEDYDSGDDDDDNENDDEDNEDDDVDNEDDEYEHMPSPKGPSRKINPCFRIKIKKINVQFPKPSMVIPHSHAEKYLLGQANGIIYLRVKEDGNVAGDYLECKYCIERRKQSQRRLSVQPWRHFVMENRLKLDDICVFELVNRDFMLYDVSILRA